MNAKDLQAYHRTITDAYDERSANHDKSEGHRKLALRLVEHMPARPSDSVLDVATGTGTIAFHAASLVGPNGKVIGIDLSEGMLAQANANLAASGLHNTKFVLADAEHLEFPPDSFDRIYCASAFFWVLDPVATLKHWLDLLKPGGVLGFHALPDTSVVWVSVAQRVLDNYGISYILNRPTGTMDKCRQLLVQAGFKNIDIWEENDGGFISLDSAKKAWIKKEDFSPGQHPNPLQNVSPEIVEQARREYEARMEALNTEKGVWDDRTMYYIYGQK